MNDLEQPGPMTPQTEEQEFLLAQLETLARARAPGELFAAFVRHYYERSSLDALRVRTPEELIQTAAGHFEMAQRRQPGEALVRARPPVDPLLSGARGLATVEVCVDDMPWLVDTVMLAVRERGALIDWGAHPVLRVRRGADGQLQDVEGAESSVGLAESWIHLETEALADAAAYRQLEDDLREALRDVAVALRDSEAMRAQARTAARAFGRLREAPTLDDPSEAGAFMDWLADGHFMFFGYSETRTQTASSGAVSLVLDPRAGLGLSRAGERYADADELMAPKEELDKYAGSGRLIVITKASQRSRLLYPEFMDVISAKHYSADGQLLGTRRFLGLFAPDVYMDRPRTIPIVRRKAEYVLRRARFPEGSHSGNLLREIMHWLPRDELFQASEKELFDTCMGIRALRERHQLKLFMRRDRYGRFYSCMVYLPRDRYTRELRDRVGAELSRLFNAVSVDREVDFLRGGTTRLRYIVRTPPGTQQPLSTADIEQRLLAVTRSWREQLREVVTRSAGPDASARLARFADAFPLPYTQTVTPLDAAADLECLGRLSEEAPTLVRLMAHEGERGATAAVMKLYSYASPVALSDVLPTLENFGLRVIAQEPTEVKPKNGPTLWIEQFEIEPPATPLSPAAMRSHFETAFLKVWSGETENDGLNRLVLSAGLDWRQVTCMRTVAKYLNQLGMPYGRADIEAQIADHAELARLLVQLFELRFDPQAEAWRREQEVPRLQQALDEALDRIASLDADRVLRACVSVVTACVRTNYYQSLPDGSRKPWVSIKLDPARIPELPMPRPMFEIWVYSPDVEGVHLRGGPVARGGIRWSDRREDFRTEVLGLMKAQMVKNAVIVPVGAKGGFVVKRPVDPRHREAFMARGIDCYKTFIRGLLDITDNRVGHGIAPPADVVRHDGDDPYLVVAADKGTATFSDIANGLAEDYGFWLGDAFASGGSAGYDHKKMGITARGAWESVKRHFREMERRDESGAALPGPDVQNEDFTVVGIGDMSGDVFGNGMLVSRHIRLIAAFDHRHVFIDPNPDAERSFAERERLFRLPRSSWADYDSSLISAGGGVWPRSAKSIQLSDEMRAALATDLQQATPAELISAILKAPVDLLWNGGIGTYVKSSDEGNEHVGDRANDAIRVNGRELRCKVVGEGGNLGLTQAGRVEYALHGGRLNTDAIDNAGGVHSSDREVNIKIPLNRLLIEGGLTREERDPLLFSMTGDIVRMVLHDNYVQPACISLEEAEAVSRLEQHVGLIRLLERSGLLNAAIEGLPDADEIAARRTAGRGLTRPELAVLVAYSKIALFDAAVASEVPDDPHLTRYLLDYFPPALVERYRGELEQHRLRREILSTILANAVVNRMGVSFALGLAEDRGAAPAEVLRAYVTAHEIFDGDRYWMAIESLDNRVPAALQYELLRRPIGLLKHATAWLVGNPQPGDMRTLVTRYREAVAAVEAQMPELLPPSYRRAWDDHYAATSGAGVPEDVARRLASSRALGSSLDIVELMHEAAVPLELASAAYYAVGELFQAPWLLGAITGLQLNGKWQQLARVDLRDDAYILLRQITAEVLRACDGDAEARLNTWRAQHHAQVDFALARLRELRSGDLADFPALVVAVRELGKLRALQGGHPHGRPTDRQEFNFAGA